jgi:rubrerythrin
MPEGDGYEELGGKATIEEILSVAVEFERSAHDFYSKMIPRVGKNIRYLVVELAEEELRHLELFNDLMRRHDLEAIMQAAIERPASDNRFSDCIHVPDLGGQPDDQAILQYALTREHAAMEQYQALAETTPAGPLRDLFRFLANEETKHKAELEKLYYEVVHSGGV